MRTTEIKVAMAVPIAWIKMVMFVVIIAHRPSLKIFYEVVFNITYGLDACVRNSFDSYAVGHKTQPFLCNIRFVWKTIICPHGLHICLKCYSLLKTSKWSNNHLLISPGSKSCKHKTILTAIICFADSNRLFSTEFACKAQVQLQFIKHIIWKNEHFFNQLFFISNTAFITYSKAS